MSMRAFLTTFLLVILLPVMASAVTVDQIVQLSKAGVSDEVLLALIDRDKSVFSIDPEQLVVIERAGVSRAVILAMLKSGGQPAPSAQSAEPLRMVGPDVTIVGHDPDVPNVSTVQNYTIFAPPIAAGGFVFAGPSLCAPAAATGPRYIRIGPPSVGRFVPDPNARFENNTASVPAHPSGLTGINCHSTSASRRPRSHR
jgi:hypothetical protein